MRVIRFGNYPIRSRNKSLRARAKLKAARGRRSNIRNKNRVESEIYERNVIVQCLAKILNIFIELNCLSRSRKKFDKRKL